MPVKQKEVTGLNHFRTTLRCRAGIESNLRFAFRKAKT